MKLTPERNILLFKSCLINVEYPGVESSTRYILEKIGVEYIVDDRQSCCTGLGYYFDLFDQLSTTAVAARNFKIGSETGHNNIVTMCATCYAILKKSAKILNENSEARNRVNEIMAKSGLENIEYHPGDVDPTENIYHVAEVFFNKKDVISKHVKVDLSYLRVATHHACHYCKVYYNDAMEGVRDPNLLDKLVAAVGVKTIGWYDHKKVTCGSGFRQRFINKEVSLDVTREKLQALKDNNVDVLIHMCPNCQMQFDRYQPHIEREFETKFNIIHLNIAQFIALAMGADPYGVLGIQTHTVSVTPLINQINSMYKINSGKIK